MRLLEINWYDVLGFSVSKWFILFIMLSWSANKHTLVCHVLCETHTICTFRIQWKYVTIPRVLKIHFKISTVFYKTHTYRAHYNYQLFFLLTDVFYYYCFTMFTFCVQFTSNYFFLLFYTCKLNMTSMVVEIIQNLIWFSLLAKMLYSPWLVFIINF